MKIAMIGSRGFNSGYSGIENMLSEVCTRLAELGCTIDVFSRNDVSTESGIPGLRAIRVRSIGGKHFENITRSAFATIMALRRYDVIHFHAIGPGILSALTMCCGQPSIVTVQGLDYNRDKWGTVAKTALRLAERTSVLCAGYVTVVAPNLKQHFKQSYGCEVTFIPNGFKVQTRRPAGPGLAALGLTPGYLLFAGRLTPEKGLVELIEAFKHVQTTRRLVIAGEARERSFYEHLQRMTDQSRIAFVGRQSGDILAELFSNAYLHILPSYIEGWSLALTEAIGYRIPSLASDIDANREVMGENGFYFKTGKVVDLEQMLTRLLQDQETIKAMSRHLETIHLPDWDEVTMDYLKLYRSLVASTRYVQNKAKVTTQA